MLKNNSLGLISDDDVPSKFITRKLKSFPFDSQTFYVLFEDRKACKAIENCKCKVMRLHRAKEKCEKTIRMQMSISRVMWRAEKVILIWSGKKNTRAYYAIEMAMRMGKKFKVIEY